VLVQTKDPFLVPMHRDMAVAELHLVINEVARCEVESLCSLCRNRMRPTPPSTSTAAAVDT
jgi:hypothetical protein